MRDTMDVMVWQTETESTHLSAHFIFSFIKPKAKLKLSDKQNHVTLLEKHTKSNKYKSKINSLFHMM